MSDLTASLDGPPGAPVLVLGNSLGTSRMVWDRQAVALGERYRLLRYARDDRLVHRRTRAY